MYVDRCRWVDNSEAYIYRCFEIVRHHTHAYRKTKALYRFLWVKRIIISTLIHSQDVVSVGRGLSMQHSISARCKNGWTRLGVNGKREKRNMHHASFASEQSCARVTKCKATNQHLLHPCMHRPATVIEHIPCRHQENTQFA